jgi:two-component system, OmpR family, catabolic regulation response regulator CreB
MKTHVLIVEDEAAIADTLVYVLETEGFIVSWVSLVHDAEIKLSQEKIDFIILDVGLPDQNGFEFCKKIRNGKNHYSNIPILFLTARKEEVDRIIGLEIGGDDYVVKPFSPREISARVKTILKRFNQPQQQQAVQPDDKKTYSQKSKFQLDEEKAKVVYCGKSISLTRYELKILASLLAHPERVFSRAQLMDKVWDEPESSFERAVDTHIKSLRAKLREVNDQDDPIKTHRGLGYSISL